MCTGSGRKVKPTNKIVNAYKRFNVGGFGRLFPVYRWHGRGLNGYKRGVWLDAEIPADGELREPHGYGFHAYRSRKIAENAMIADIYLVKFRQVVFRSSQILVAHQMLIPKKRKSE